MSSVSYAIGYNPDPVLGNLQEAASYLKTILSPAAPDGQYTRPQERHEGGVPRQNPDEAVVGRRDDRVRRTVEDGLLRGDDGDVHQALAIFLACATTSSMPPAI